MGNGNKDQNINSCGDGAKLSHRRIIIRENLSWEELFMDEELKTLTDNEVLAEADKLMDEFDEAFKELAK